MAGGFVLLRYGNAEDPGKSNRKPCNNPIRDFAVLLAANPPSACCLQLFAMKKMLRLAALLLLAAACSTDVNINAPAKDIWVVYSILDPSKPVQYVRVAKAFLPQGDALQFAKENDISAKGLTVILSGGGKSWQAVQVDSVPKTPPDGIFNPYTTLYRFDTQTQPLEDGQRYSLRITHPDSAGFELRAGTTIPSEPTVRRPVLTVCAGAGRGLQALNIEKAFLVEWSMGSGRAFELRSYFAYQEDGRQDTVVIGPSQLITDSRGCSSQSQACYRFSDKELSSGILNKMQQRTGSQYTYQDAPTCAQPSELAKSFWFEVTAMDTALANYIIANDPKFTDFNTVRPEYSNVRGSTETLGIFGSLNKSVGYAALGRCARYLLNLNDETQPTASCVP